MTIKITTRNLTMESTMKPTCKVSLEFDLLQPSSEKEVNKERALLETIVDVTRSFITKESFQPRK